LLGNEAVISPVKERLEEFGSAVKARKANLEKEKR
jgi:hypothetical protein